MLVKSASQMPVSEPALRIAVASGKGGTGKTMVSTNLFYTLLNAQNPASLVDCDAEAPNDLLFFKGEAEGSFEVTQMVPVIDTDRCTYCGRCRDDCHYNAIFILPSVPMIRVMEELCHGCGACSVACRYSAITEKEVSLGRVSRMVVSAGYPVIEARMNEGVYSPVPVIKEAIREAGTEGIILLDAPPGTSCSFIQTVSRADYVVLVTEPTPFGLSDLRQSVETLKTIGKPCGVVVNRAGLGHREVYDYLAVEQIPLLMEIPFDRELAALYAQGKVASAESPLWREKFNLLLTNILSHNGNSRHQR